MEKVCLLKSCIWLIHTLVTSYKYCRDKEVTAILRHLSPISIGSYRLQGTPECHSPWTPHSNRATGNQLPLRPCAIDQYPWSPQFNQFSIHLILHLPSQFSLAIRAVRGDLSLKALLKSKYSTFSVLPLRTWPHISSLKAIRLVRHDP